MSSIFLSHTSIDKPFVEKLAKDLKRIGINVWYDRWEIVVGESITWKIEQAIRENEYLGLVLSKEALESEWVKSEIGAAFYKQMTLKKVVILPIYYRNCEIPYLLADKKYADFRSEYEIGFRDLLSVFGIKNTETISESNWRIFVKSRSSNWQKFRIYEFESLVTVLIDKAIDYKWSAWVGNSKCPFIIRFSAKVGKNEMYVTFKLDRKNNSYWVSLKNEYNPKYLKNEDFNIYLGNYINYCEEYLWRIMEDFKNEFGTPEEKAIYNVSKHLNDEEKMTTTIDTIKRLSWYKGNRILEI